MIDTKCPISATSRISSSVNQSYDVTRNYVHDEPVWRSPPDLGNRSALEWILDQYKERKPRDPTIRERFNTYRFADHKEHVIDLLQRVCTVSVEIVRIVDQLAELSNIKPTQDQQSNPHMVTLPRSGPSS